MTSYPSSDPPTIPGQPEGVRALAQNLTAAFDGIGTIQSTMEQSGIDSWSGESSSQYVGKLDQFRPQLSRILEALTGTAGTLNGYSGALANWQSVSQSSQSSLDSTRGSLAQQQSSLQSAQAHSAAVGQQHDAETDPQKKSALASLWDDAKSDVSKLEGVVGQLEQDLENLLAKAWDNFQNYEREGVNWANQVASHAEHLEHIMFHSAAALGRDMGRGIEAGWGAVDRGWHAAEHGAESLAEDAYQGLKADWPAIHRVLADASTAIAVTGLVVGMAALLVVPGAGEVADGAIAATILSVSGSGAFTAAGLSIGAAEVGGDLIAGDDKDLVDDTVGEALNVITLGTDKPLEDAVGSGIDDAISDSDTLASGAEKLGDRLYPVIDQGAKDVVQGIDFGVGQAVPVVHKTVDGVVDHPGRALKDLIDPVSGLDPADAGTLVNMPIPAGIL